MSVRYLMSIWPPMVCVINIHVGITVFIVMANAYDISLVITLNDGRVWDVVYRYSVRCNVIFEIVTSFLCIYAWRF